MVSKAQRVKTLFYLKKRQIMILGLNNVIDGAIFGATVCENLVIFYLNKNKLYLAKNSGVRNKFFFFF